MSAEIEETQNTTTSATNGVDKIAGKTIKSDEMTTETESKHDNSEDKDVSNEAQVQNGKDVDPKKENLDELLDELDEDSQLLNLTASARMISLKMLLQGKVLQPGKSVMTVEYLGQKFYGDLLEDGRIKSQETEAIFCSPSAWAINCKRIINPDKKSGVGWSSIKYKGKKLDVYKALYQKKCLDKRNELDSCARESEQKKDENKPEEWTPPSKRIPVQHSTIYRTKEYDINTLVEAVPFQKIQKIQPFMLSFSSSALLLMDFHCHLTKNEVCGYFGGSWDLDSLSVNVTHTFPCLNSRFDRDKSAECEKFVLKSMNENNCNLIGWYHSHPFFNVNPTIRDCDSQLKYQIKMGGNSLETHTPCIGVICSTYDEEIDNDEAKYLPFWVVPPADGKLHDCAKPVILQYTVKQDEKLSDNIKHEMENCLKYYKQFDNELIDFTSKLHEDSPMKYVEKLKMSMFAKFPKEEADGSFWNWILEQIGVDKEDPVEIPQTVLEKVQKRQEEAEQIQKLFTVPKLPAPLMDRDKLTEKMKSEHEKHRARLEEEANRATLNAISCLQQQLSLPSGLNMTPSPISSSIILPSTIKNNNNQRSNNISKSSTSSSNKVDISVRATPSPARSDHSHKSRSSPAANQNQNQKSQSSSRPSSSGSSGKYDLGLNSLSASNINDIYAATLASLASKLPPGLIPMDLLKTMPDYGLSALNALTAQAAMYANPGPSATSSPSNKKNSTSSQSAPATSQSKSSQNSSYSTPKQSSSSSSSNYHHSTSTASQHHNQTRQSSSSASGSSSSRAAAAQNSWFDQIPNMKEFMAQLEKGDLSVLMQSPYNIPTCKSSSSKSEKNHHSNSNNPISNSSSSSSSARTNYHQMSSPSMSSESNKRKQSKNYDYENYKNEAGKIADLMKSPEYTQMLLQQAQAFRGLGTEITVTRKPSSTVTSQSAKKQAATAAEIAAANVLKSLPVMDLNTMAELAKTVPEINALLNSNNPEDINALLQMQSMSQTPKDYPTASSRSGSGSGKSNTSSSSSSSKMKSDYPSSMSDRNAAAAVAAANSNLLSQYMLGTPDLSSIFGPMSSLYGMGVGGLAGLNMLPTTTSSGGLSSHSYSQSNAQQSYDRKQNYGHSSPSSSKKKESSQSSKSNSSHSSVHSKTTVAPNAADMLNSLFAGTQPSKSNSSSNSLLKPDLNSYFGGMNANSLLTQSPSSKTNNSTSGGGITSFDYSSFFSHMSPAKIQEMSTLFSQNKYPGIPDPLAKSTLAANNMYLSPSLMKLQQEALNTMLMKPPKSSSSSSSSKIETPPPISASPSLDKRSTPTKSSRDSPATMSSKYHNFSAADLAISSVPSMSDYSRKSSSSSSSHDYKSLTSQQQQQHDFGRKSTPTPPVAASQDTSQYYATREKEHPPVPIKKRMEFSSIAELVGSPPSKVAKYSNEDDDGGVLNLSNNK